LTLTIANKFATADERFWHALQSASSGLILKPIDGDFLSILPGVGKGCVCLPEYRPANFPLAVRYTFFGRFLTAASPLQWTL
jgi:hypothetical protein